MSKALDLSMPFTALLLFWLLLNGVLAADVVTVGVIAALVVATLFRKDLAVVSEFRATPRAFVATVFYLGRFLRELILSNLRLAGVVLAPSLPVNPGIVKVRTRLKSRMGRLLLANSITLTPGTLTVELDGEWFYIHWVTVESPEIEAATAAIVASFEKHLEAMYG